MRRKIFSVMLSLTMVLCLFPASASACTALYVGDKVSADGTTIIARCSDSHPLYGPIRMDRHDAKDTAGTEYKQVANDFIWQFPEETYSYVSLAQWECKVAEEGRFAGYALNENGVNLTATTTGYICKEAEVADPYEVNGIMEEGIPDILGPSCKTAREAVELLAEICDEQGSNESNIVMINDQNEAWYMEMYTGHQYAAVLMPDDAVAVYGNEFMLENLEDYNEVIASSELESLPAKAGFAEYDSDGKFNIFNTYAGKGRLADYANRRTWYGHYAFSPSTAGEYNTTTKYPLFYQPDEKISVSDIMSLLRSRFEGTEFDADVVNGKESRVIGTETQEEVHIIQTYKDLPADRCAVAWTTLSQSECNVFLPVFSCMEEFDAAFIKDNAECVIDDEAAYSVFKELNTLATTNRKLYKPAVVEYWNSLEQYLMKTVPEAMAASKELSDKAAHQYLTAYGVKVEKAAFEDAKALADDVLMAMAENNDTLKSKFDYDTLTYGPADDPVQTEVSLSTEDFDTKYSLDEPATTNVGLLAAIAVVVLALVAVVIKRRSRT